MRHIVPIQEGDIELSGNWLYVSKCLQPETFNDTVIIRTEDAQRYSCAVEVLGIGPDVGSDRKESNHWLRSNGIQKRSELGDIELGCVALLPNDHPLITLSPFDKNEFFVDAGIVKGLVHDA